MISAFGVDHGQVAKSLVGGVWKPASALSRTERGAMGGYKQARGVNQGDKKWLENRRTVELPSLKAHIQEHGAGVKVHPEGQTAGTVRVGGKSSGESHVIGAVPKPLRRGIAAHEAQHANVKRSSYRLHRQIMSNPKKMMREEARADYRSIGHYKTTKQPGAYAEAAQALERTKTHGKWKNWKFTGAQKKQIRGTGEAVPKVSNQQVQQFTQRRINQMLPHYNLQGKKGRKAIGAYGKLQNQMQTKGVPQGQHGLKPPKGM